jgi:hypothetical protein
LCDWFLAIPVRPGAAFPSKSVVVSFFLQLTKSSHTLSLSLLSPPHEVMVTIAFSAAPRIYGCVAAPDFAVCVVAFSFHLKLVSHFVMGKTDPSSEAHIPCLSFVLCFWPNRDGNRSIFSFIGETSASRCRRKQNNVIVAPQSRIDDDPSLHSFRTCTTTNPYHGRVGRVGDALQRRVFSVKGLGTCRARGARTD